MKIKSLFKTSLKIIVALVLVFWLIQKGVLDVEELWQKTQWYHLLLGVVWCWLMVWANALRWWFLLKSSLPQFPVWQSFRLTIVGLFFNYALPGGVGGDVVKGYYLVKGSTQGRMAPLMSIAMDRLVGFWAMSFLALLGFCSQWSLASQDTELMSLGLAVFLLFITFTFIFVFSFFVNPQFFKKRKGAFFENKLYSLFVGVFENLHELSKNLSSLGTAFFLSLISQSIAVVFMIFVARLLGHVDLSWWVFFFVVPLGFISMALPIAPAGLGVGQAVLFFLFNMILGYESSIGPNVITAFQFTLLISALPGAYFYLKMKPVLSQELNHA